jgi:hypothetical protein
MGDRSTRVTYNRILCDYELQRDHNAHLRQLSSARKKVDNSAPMLFTHIRNRKTGFVKQRERDVRRDNLRILQHVQEILEADSKYIRPKRTHVSSNCVNFRRKLTKIQRENMQMNSRLSDKNRLAHKDEVVNWRKHSKKTRDLLRLMKKKPFPMLKTHTPRPPVPPSRNNSSFSSAPLSHTRYRKSKTKQKRAKTARSSSSSSSSVPSASEHSPSPAVLLRRRQMRSVKAASRNGVCVFSESGCAIGGVEGCICSVYECAGPARFEILVYDPADQLSLCNRVVLLHGHLRAGLFADTPELMLPENTRPMGEALLAALAFVQVRLKSGRTARKLVLAASASPDADLYADQHTQEGAVGVDSSQDQTFTEQLKFGKHNVNIAARVNPTMPTLVFAVDCESLSRQCVLQIPREEVSYGIKYVLQRKVPRDVEEYVVRAFELFEVFQKHTGKHTLTYCGKTVMELDSGSDSDSDLDEKEEQKETKTPSSSSSSSSAASAAAAAAAAAASIDSSQCGEPSFLDSVPEREADAVAEEKQVVIAADVSVISTRSSRASSSAYSEYGSDEFDFEQ